MNIFSILINIPFIRAYLSFFYKCYKLFNNTQYCTIQYNQMINGFTMQFMF